MLLRVDAGRIAAEDARKQAVCYTVAQRKITQATQRLAAAPGAQKKQRDDDLNQAILALRSCAERPSKLGKLTIFQQKLYEPGDELAFRQTVTQSLKQFQACYARALRADPLLGGTTHLHFQMVKKGSHAVPADPRTSYRGLNGSRIGLCLVRRARELRFPAQLADHTGFIQFRLENAVRQISRRGRHRPSSAHEVTRPSTGGTAAADRKQERDGSGHPQRGVTRLAACHGALGIPHHGGECAG